ncbi:MAG: glycosyltransferase family 4 protein [Bacteriovoracaceae bacterium]
MRVRSSKTLWGTERVVANLTQGLIEQGHEVTLFASGDSITGARLISGCEQGLRLDKEIQDPVAFHARQLDVAISMEKEFDIIHFHTDYLHFPLLKYMKTPALTTVHGRLDLKEVVSLYRRFKLDAALTSISYAQRAPLTDNHWAGNVYHGLPLGLFKPVYKKGSYLAFLGRISPEKGLDRAIDIAKRLNMPLKVAAKIDKADQDYFEQHIKDLMEDPLVEYVGEIAEARKEAFLGNAMGLLFPINWPEPFGMVLIESMACATPVLAFKMGSAREVVDDGASGILVESVEEAVARAPELFKLDRRKVREVFERRFDQETMTRNYIKIYQELINESKQAEYFEEAAFL